MSILSSSLPLSSALLAEDPIQLGYERWTKTDAQSRTTFGHDAAHFQFDYKTKLTDIEVRWEGNRWVYDGIQVDTVGFQGWFLPDMSYDVVNNLNGFKDTYIADLETHGTLHSVNGENARYSAVVRWNPRGFKTKVFVAALWSEFAPYAFDTEKWRPIDIDVLDIDPPGEHLDGEYKFPDAYDEKLTRYNVVFVQNDDPLNHKETLMIAGDIDDINEQARLGYQLIDIEDSGGFYKLYNPDRPYHMIFVRSENLFWYSEKLTPYSWLAKQKNLRWIYDQEYQYGPCIDIEGRPYDKDLYTRGFQAVFRIQ
ncbi:MAG: hypothetical protein WBD31_25010 [Rubripirellula sp.]